MKTNEIKTLNFSTSQNNFTIGSIIRFIDPISGINNLFLIRSINQILMKSNLYTNLDQYTYHVEAIPYFVEEVEFNSKDVDFPVVTKLSDF